MKISNSYSTPVKTSLNRGDANPFIKGLSGSMSGEGRYSVDPKEISTGDMPYEFRIYDGDLCVIVGYTTGMVHVMGMIKDSNRRVRLYDRKTRRRLV